MSPLKRAARALRGSPWSDCGSPGFRRGPWPCDACSQGRVLDEAQTCRNRFRRPRSRWRPPRVRRARGAWRREARPGALRHVGQNLLHDSQHVQVFLRSELRLRGQILHLPRKDHAAPPQRRLESIADRGEERSQVVHLGVHRVDQQPHLVEGVTQGGRQLRRIRIPALHHGQGLDQARAETVVHLAHHASALLA